MDTENLNTPTMPSGQNSSKADPDSPRQKFSLLKISELYGSEEEIYFLDSDNKAIKVLDIKKVPYSGKIYDVTAENHIILVRRGNLTVWSGNSYNGTGAKVYDYSGNGNNGTCYGTCFYNETGGKFQGAFEFDGDGDYVDLGDNADLEPSEFTLSVWFNARFVNAAEHQHILADGKIASSDAGNDDSYSLWIKKETDDLYFSIDNSGSETDITTSGLQTTTWYHAAAVSDASGIKLYVNGILEDNSTNTFTISNSQKTIIGGVDDAYSGSIDFFFNGTIDEVAIYNRSLSATEILSHYQLKAGRYYWYANLSDGYLMNQTPTRNYWVDNTAPSITLNYPGAGGYLGSLTVNFNWTATDNLREGMYCNLSIDGAVNQSNISVANNTAENYTVQLSSVGSHNWSTTCWDNISKDGANIGNVNTSATNSFTISLTLTYGSPGYANPIDVDAVQNISINVSSGIGVSRVWVHVDGDSVNHTMANSTNGYYYNFSLSGYSLGNKTFTIWMNDTVNTVNSTNGTFEIDNISVSISINDSHPHTYDTIEITGNIVLYHSATAKENLTSRTVYVYLNGTLNGTNTTNSTGEYSRNIPVPDTLGSHSITVNVTSSNNIYGEGTTTFLVWAPTKVNYTSSPDYTLGINAQYNVTNYYFRNDTGAADTGTLNLTIENSSGVILYRNCSSASQCSRIFDVGPTGSMRAGNYTLNLSAVAGSSYHDNASSSQTITLEEPGAVGTFRVNNKTISDFVTEQSYNYQWNATLNSSWSTMINPMIYNTTTGLSGFVFVALNNCTNTSHLQSCVVTFNITLGGSTPQDDFQVTWKANWTNYNGSVTTMTTTSQISIASNADMNLTGREINLTENVSSMWQYNINLTNTGNTRLDNVAVSVYNISSSWFVFHSDDQFGWWDSDNNKWSQVDTAFTVPLYVNITVGNFTEANYTGRLNFTCDEGINREVNITIVVDPNITVGANISANVTRNSSSIRNLTINSTGNAKLVNVTVNYINQSMPSGWLSFNSTPGNITEGTYYNLSINVTIPEYQSPGLYRGVMEINSSNQDSVYRNITIQVPINNSWRFTPTSNQTNEFGYDQSGIVGNLTIVNYGNVPLNFTISYGNVPGAYSCSAISCLTENNNVSGTIMNPTSKYVAKNSSENFAVYMNSKSQSYTNVGIKITMQSNGTPTSNIAYMFYNITNQPPVVYSYEILVDGVNQSYAEINKNVTFSLIVQDDEPEANGINESSAIFNFTKPDGTKSSHTPTRTNWATYGDYRDGEKFTLQYNATNITGNYTMAFYVKDLSENERRANFSFQVINATTITLVASVGQADSVTTANSQNLTVTANITNHGLAKGYSSNLTVVSLTTNWSSDTTSAGNLTKNATSQSNVTITVAAGTAPGNYSGTVLVEWRQPSNAKSNATTGITVEVLSNYGIGLQPNNRSLTVDHGSSNTTWFIINMTGNTGASIYSVSTISTADNLTVTYSPSGGALSPGNTINVTVNASADEYANASSRLAVLNVTIGSDSMNFTLNVTTPLNSSWSVNVENLTINAYPGINIEDYNVNVSHQGTGNVTFNFTFNLTGNVTTYMNLTRNNRTLNASGSFTIGLNHTALGGTAQYYGNLTIRELNYGVNKSVDIYYVVQSYSLHISNMSSPAMVEPGNLINVTTELYSGSTYVTANTSYVVYINYTACSSTTWSAINSTSMLLNCTAPSKAGSRTYYLLSVNASYNVSGVTVKASDSEVVSIYYRDVYPPQILSSNITDVTPGVTVNITINASDDTGVSRIYAEVDPPSGSNFNVNLSLTAGRYNASISNLTTQGYYNITFHVNDTLGNDNTSSSIFEVYTAKELSGVLQTSDVPPVPIQVTFSLRSMGPDRKVMNISTNSTGHYQGEAKYFTGVSTTKLYDVLIDTLNTTFNLSSVYFGNLSSDFINLDELDSAEVDLSNSLKGVAVNASLSISGKVEMRYAQAEVTSLGYKEAWLTLFRCSSWNYTSLDCLTNWTNISGSSVDKTSNKVTAEFTSFTSSSVAYAIAELEPTTTTSTSTTTTSTTSIPTTTTVLPSVKPYRPENNANISSPYDFKCNATNGTYVVNYTELWGNWSEWHLNETNTQNGSGIKTFENISFDPGSYKYTCSVVDRVNSTVWASQNWTFHVTTTIPVPNMVIEHLYPVVTSAGEDTNINFTLRSTGTAAVNNIRIYCLSDTVCTDFEPTYLPSIPILNVSESRNLTMNISIPSYYSVGTYTGMIYVVSETLFRNATAFVILTEELQKVTGLSAVDSGDKITLSWNPNTDETVAYRVHRSTESGFTAGDSNLLTTVDGISSTTYEDLSPLTGVTYYYRIVAIDAYNTAARQSSQASASLSCEYQFTEGWNLISVPLDVGNMTAQQFLDLVGNSAKEIVMWNATSQSYISHVDGFHINDFELDGGNAYWLNLMNETEFEFNGYRYARNVTINLSEGWNLIGWVNASEINAQGVMDMIGAEAMIMAYYNTTTGEHVSHVNGLETNNFVISNKMGYWLYLNESKNLSIAMVSISTPRNPHPVYGYVYKDATPQLNASVTLINLNTSDNLFTTTAEDGSYTFDISTLENYYAAGDLLNITASYGRFMASITVTATDTSYQQVDDLILSAIEEVCTLVENFTVNESKRIDAGDTTLEIVTNGDIVNTEITVVKSPEIQINVTLLGDTNGIAYLEINASDELNNNLDRGRIEVSYIEEEVREVDVKTLGIYLYNETPMEWERLKETGVNEEDRYVWANVSHFSYYAVAGERPKFNITLHEGWNLISFPFSL